MNTSAPKGRPAIESDSLELFRAIAHARRILNDAYAPAARKAREDGYKFQEIADAGEITRPSAYTLVSAA